MKDKRTPAQFQRALKGGLIGESKVAKWLIGRNWNVLPTYETELSSGKAPRLFTGVGSIISPDMMIFRDGRFKWVEAKTKSSFTWYRLSGTWQDGIDKVHWEEYLRVAEQTKVPLFIMFLHLGHKIAKDTPPGKIPPRGLYGANIEHLAKHIHHTSRSHGPTGMVYWNINTLTLIAEASEFEVADDEF